MLLLFISYSTLGGPAVGSDGTENSRLDQREFCIHLDSDMCNSFHSFYTFLKKLIIINVYKTKNQLTNKLTCSVVTAESTAMSLSRYVH